MRGATIWAVPLAIPGTRPISKLEVLVSKVVSAAKAGAGLGFMGFKTLSPGGNSSSGAAMTGKATAGVETKATEVVLVGFVATRATGKRGAEATASELIKELIQVQRLAIREH